MSVVVYKLVTTRVDGVSLSSWSETDLRFIVTYRPGEWAAPQISGTPLYAFKTDADARAWAVDSRESQLWMARADVARPYDPVKFNQSPFWRENMWLQHWRGWRNKRYVRSLQGQVICGQIKLLYRIPLL